MLSIQRRKGKNIKMSRRRDFLKEAEASFNTAKLAADVVINDCNAGADVIQLAALISLVSIGLSCLTKAMKEESEDAPPVGLKDFQYK